MSELDVAPDALLEMYRRMLTIRRFEERAAQLYRDGEVPGFVHLSIGQEAVAVGACWPLEPADAITSTHRGHGHCLAKGADVREMFAELLGRATGTCGGMGGSMHIADTTLGVLGANGIVAAGLPIANGAALASVLRGDGRVVVAFFGDGAVAQGAFHEALNLAGLWRLPVIFVCENNHFSEFSTTSSQHVVPIVDRAAAYGMEGVAVAGNDVRQVATVMGDLVARARVGEGPFLLEAETYRWHGHYEGDPQRYRDQDELAQWKRDDPLDRTRADLRAAGVPAAAVDAVDAEVEQLIEAAVAAARQDPAPPVSSMFELVLAPRGPDPDEAATGPADDDTEEWRLMDAIRAALAAELEADPDVFLAGIDVGAGGNIFALTRGLHERWPERVRDTPISETAICGLGVGAAMAGLRPVVEVMYFDFIGVCLDQLMNQAAKLRFMTGGKVQIPLVVRTQFGSGRSSGSQHSQSLEALLAHLPGLTVVMPSTPADTYGLLRAAIRDPNPTVFVEHRLTYGWKGPRPSPDHLVPIGRARVVRPGRDITIVSVSRMVWECVAAAEELAAEGIDAEVIDLRTVSPLDRATVLESVAKTSRLLVTHEAVRDFGIGAEIAAMVADEGFWYLDAPVRRVGGPFTPIPYAPNLERDWLPDRATIAAEVRALLG